MTVYYTFGHLPTLQISVVYFEIGVLPQEEKADEINFNSMEIFH